MAIEAEQRLPLNRYAVIHTSDHAAAGGSLEPVLGPHELTVSAARPDIRVHSCRLSSVLLSYVAFGAEVDLRLGPTRPSYVAALLLAGQARLHAPPASVWAEAGAEAESGMVLPPDAPATMWCSADCRLLVVGVDADDLQAHARNLLSAQPDDPLRFQVAMDLTAGRTRDWYKVLRSFVDLANAADGILGHPLMMAEAERALMTGLLLAQPNSYSWALHDSVGDQEHTPIDAAILLINTQPQRNHMAAELARVAGVSVRTLEKEFRRRLGLPPHAYLRQVRLRRIRGELMAPTAEKKRVSEVAARWGLHHFGRFARDYYLKYHEKPSETVRRSRRQASS